MSDETFRCSLWGRALPYAMAAGILVSGMLVAGEVPPGFAAARSFRALLTVAAGAVGLWVLRKGAETRQRVRLSREAVELEYGSRARALSLSEIEHVGYCGPFSRGRHWLPATVLVDRQGLEWRLSALLERGDVLVAAIGEAAGRAELISWIEARGVVSAMRAVRRRLIFGYGLALGLPIAAAIYRFIG